MGKMTLILVVGLAVIVGITGTTMVKRASQSKENNMALYEVAQAKNIAKSAREIYLTALKSNPGLRGTFQLRNLLGGAATVSLTEVTPTRVKLQATGNYGDESKMAGLYVETSIAPPPINAALEVTASSKLKMDVGGGTLIDGTNHGKDEKPEKSKPGVAGISVATEDQKAKIKIAKDAAIRGKNHATKDLSVEHAQPEFMEWSRRLVSLADVNLNGDKYDYPVTLGSPSKWQIVHIEKKCEFKEPITGYGVLIVEGDLKAKKGINWTGVIIAAGESDGFDDENFETKEKVDLRDGTILGAVLVGGTKVKVKTKDLDILYSAVVVSEAMKLISVKDAFTVTDWFE